MLSPNGIVTAEKRWLMFVSAFFQQLNCLIWKFARASYGRRTFQIGRRHCFFLLRLKKGSQVFVKKLSTFVILLLEQIWLTYAPDVCCFFPIQGSDSLDTRNGQWCPKLGRKIPWVFIRWKTRVHLISHTPFPQ